MEKIDIEKILFFSDGTKYGDKYVEHLLDQYKLYINATEKISDRRQKTNEFFLGLNTALVALLGFISTKVNQIEINSIIILSSIAGITVCYLWYRIIKSYKCLNDAKFKVVHAIESRLPLALYDTEWEMLGRGNDNSKYWPFSHIELLVPNVFILIYLILISSIIPWSFILDIKAFNNFEYNLSRFKILNSVSLTLSFLGSLSFAKGLFISQKQALELGVSRWSGASDKENLKLPQVRDRLNQRNWAILGATLISIGFIIQIILI